MDKTINIAVYELKQNLIQSVNSSGLPLCVSSYVLNEVKSMVDIEGTKALETELKAYNESQNPTAEIVDESKEVNNDGISNN